LIDEKTGKTDLQVRRWCREWKDRRKRKKPRDEDTQRINQLGKENREKREGNTNPELCSERGWFIHKGDNS
jgi:hypothetical protein